MINQHASLVQKDGRKHMVLSMRNKLTKLQNLRVKHDEVGGDVLV
jgi:hypothetical protein